MSASRSEAPLDGANPALRAARMLVSAPIVFYQRVISPALPRRCKYEPTCSRYALDAVREYGILKGLVLAGWRLLRCNPWSYGGYDPVEAQQVFKATGLEQPPRDHPGACKSHRAPGHSEPTTNSAESP